MSSMPNEFAGVSFTDIRKRRRDLEKQIRDLETQIAPRRNQPIGYRPPVDVEFYVGGLNVSVDFVRRYSPAIGLVEWNDDLNVGFGGTGDDPGDVNGEPWATGALLRRNLFLTSGHCFDPSGDSRRRPSRNGRAISPEEIARLMHVKFNFQRSAEVDAPAWQTKTYPVVRLIEHRLGGIDYAIIELGRNSEGRLPNQDFGYLMPAMSDVPVDEIVCLMHHPNGRPKMVDTGVVVRNAGGVVAYVDLETNGGTSGAPLLYPCEGNGPAEIVGVHQRGGFSRFSGSSMGVAIGAIRAVSKELK